jgi:hypothetical protein
LERGQFERDESSTESRVQWKPDSTLKSGFVDQQAVWRRGVYVITPVRKGESDVFRDLVLFP